MAGADLVSFFCSACGKKYKVPGAMAGRKAKCKDCGHQMQVPALAAEAPGANKTESRTPKPKAPVEDDTLRLVEDDEPSPYQPYSAPPAAPATPRPVRSDPTRSDAPRQKPQKSKPTEAKKADDPLGLGQGQGLDGDEPVGTEDWLSALAPAAVSVTPDRVYRAKGGGFGAMKQALLASLQKGSGDVPLNRRISFGGLFILVAAVVCIIAANTASDVRIGGGSAGYGFSSLRQTPSPAEAADSMPGVLVGGIGLIIGTILVGRRIYAPRQDAENPLIIVICAALVLTVGVVSFFTLVGAGTSAVAISGLGILAVLGASAILGGWVIYRLNQDASGLAIGRWLLPAILIPIGSIFAALIEIAILSKGEADFGALPWGPILLGMLIAGVIIFFMGSVVALYLVFIVPVFLLVSEVRFGTGMVIMLFVLLICIYCYVSVFKDNWRELAKPVAWQFTMLFFGIPVMVNMVGAAARAQVGIDQSTVASEKEKAQKHFDQTGERTEASSEFKRAIKRKLMVEEGLDPNDSFDVETNIVTVTSDGEFELSFLYISSGLRGYSPDEWDGKLPPMSFAQVKAMGNGGSDGAQASRSTNSSSSRGSSSRGTSRTDDDDLKPTPVVTAEQLPAGQPRLDASGEVWAPFGLPESAGDRLNGKSINLGGVVVPEATGVTVDVMKRGRDVKFLKLVDESSQVPGFKPEMQMSIRFAEPISPAEWVAAFDDGLDNMLRAARISRAERYADRYSCQFGTIGGMRMMRFEVFPVKASRGTGVVQYTGYLPGVEGRWISLSIQTDQRDPESLQRFESIVRSISLEQETWAQPPAASATAGESGLVDQDRDLSDASTLVGPVALPPTQAARSIEFVETEIAHGVIEPATLVLQNTITDPQRSFRHRENVVYFKCVPAIGRDPDLAVPRVRLTGSSEITDIEEYVVSAYGGEVSYINLWDDQTFVRIDHGIVSIENGASTSPEQVLYKVTYAGFLGDFYYHVDLMMEPDATGQLLLDHAFRSGQLLAMENVEDYQFRSSGFGKSLIDNRLDFPAKGGVSFREMVDANPSDLYVFGYGTGPDKIDRSTPPSGRPGVEVPGAPPRYSEVEPKMLLEELKAYREWRPFGGQDSLGEAVTVAGYEIQAPSDLRMINANARGARWVPPGVGSSVGMILELEPLKPEHHNLTHPILIDEQGNRSYLLGPRVVPDRSNAEITYREEHGVRVWRILPEYDRDERIATCYYCVQGAEQMIVLTARFQPSKMEQLRVFDAAAATLKPAAADAQDP